MNENKAQQERCDAAGCDNTAHRDVVRQMLAKRYHGAIEITDAMVDAVMARI